MTVPFALRHAAREARSGVRRVGWFLGAVSMGVAVLVALYGFQKDAGESARAEARFILGGDVRLEAASAFDDTVVELLDSLAADGATVARGISLATVVFAPASGAARLLQVNAVDASFPAAGTAQGDPAGVPGRLATGGGLAADGQVLRQLGVAPGDSVRVGTSHLEVLGSIWDVPVDLELQWAVGPPAFVSLADLGDLGLLGFGSLSRHRAWIAFEDLTDVRRFVRRHRGKLRNLGVSVRTADEEAGSLEAGFEELARFLSLVGLMALILGGIGVGNAVGIYLREKRSSIAVLRCLGARRGTLVGAYLVQTAGLGAGGALLGVLVGVGAQFSLPLLLGTLLPFDLSPRLRPEAVGAGIALGTWIAVVFSLLPLLRVHGISPLVALRAHGDEELGRSALLGAGVGVLVWLSVLGVAWLQLGGFRPGLVVAVGLAAVFTALGAVAWALVRASRILLPRRAPFPLRQGLSGLFRPGNQTTAVVTALGLGVFLIASLLVVEEGLRAELSFTLGPAQPSLVLFDIQVDQAEGIRRLLRGEGLAGLLIPIIPARLEEVRGEPVAAILEQRRRGPSWMYRRLYRNTYRSEVGPAERVTEGRWWGAEETENARVREAVIGGAVRVSLEQDLAADLGVGVGDVITWDVQGAPVQSVVSSLREVQWTSFQPNFFAVFQPGRMDDAPGTFVALVEAEDPTARDDIVSAVLTSFPNVSFLDVTRVRETLEGIASRISLVLRSMAGFVLGGGGLVLLASLLTTRFRRRRESALLKTLGASGRTIRGVLLAEYVAIGAIGGAAGVLLGGVGGRFLLSWQFDLAGSMPWGTLLSLWAGVLVLAVAVGWSVSGPVLRATPMSVLRQEGG